jgi:hypothetical protein
VLAGGQTFDDWNTGYIGPEEWSVGIDLSNDLKPEFSIQRLDYPLAKILAPSSVILPYYSTEPGGKACVVQMEYKDFSQPYLGYHFVNVFGDTCGGGDSIEYHDVYGAVWETIIVRDSSTSLVFAKRRVPSAPPIPNFVATQFRLRPDAIQVANIFEKLDIQDVKLNIQDANKVVGRCDWVERTGKNGCNRISSAICAELHGKWKATATCEDSSRQAKPAPR